MGIKYCNIVMQNTCIQMISKSVKRINYMPHSGNHFVLGFSDTNYLAQIRAHDITRSTFLQIGIMSTANSGSCNSKSSDTCYRQAESELIILSESSIEENTFMKTSVTLYIADIAYRIISQNRLELVPFMVQVETS